MPFMRAAPAVPSHVCATCLGRAERAVGLALQDPAGTASRVLVLASRTLAALLFTLHATRPGAPPWGAQQRVELVAAQRHGRSRETGGRRHHAQLGTTQAAALVLSSYTSWAAFLDQTGC
jgi:hypothetical protein